MSSSEIVCQYDAASKSLTFDLYEDLGGVTITVMNQTTGETEFGYCSETPGQCVVYISGEAGSYSIEIEAEGGAIYTGSFFLEE